MGARWDCTITSPAGSSASFSCRFSDTSMEIDAGTGEVSMGRQLFVSVLMADLQSAGFLAIKGIPDDTSKPWTVEIDDVIGRTGNYKVVRTLPDSTLGCMVLWLEKYVVTQ